jgi:hypothetical protein
VLGGIAVMLLVSWALYEATKTDDDNTVYYYY